MTLAVSRVPTWVTLAPAEMMERSIFSALDVRAGADRGVGAHVGVADGRPGPDDDGAHEDAAPDLGTLVDADAALDPVGVARSLGHVGGDLVQDDPVELQQVDDFAAIGAPGVDEADVDRPSRRRDPLGHDGEVDACADLVEGRAGIVGEGSAPATLRTPPGPNAHTPATPKAERLGSSSARCRRLWAAALRR